MKIEGGYLLQPRCVDDSDIAHMAPVVRELWQYLLRKVNFIDGRKLLKGQGFFCLSDIQNDLCWYAGYRKMTYSKPQLTKSLRKLREGNMIATTKATRGVIVTILNYAIYQDPKNYESNDGGNTKATRRQRPGITISKEGKEEEKETTDIVGRIIDHLNEKANRNFRKTESATDIIKARIAEKFTEDDFLKAIENQVAEWTGTEYEKYLRPATLFQKSKFDGYVNNVKSTTGGAEWQ